MAEEEKRENNMQRGKKTIKAGNRQGIGMWLGMLAGYLYGLCTTGNIETTYLCIGMLLGLIIGAKICKTISNDEEEYLEHLRTESYEMEDYLASSYYIDYEEETVRQKADEIITPIHEKYRRENAEYIEGLEFFWEKYGSLVMKSEEELKEIRKKWEMGHPAIFAGKKKAYAEKYWTNVEKIFPVWQTEVTKALYEYVRKEIMQIADDEGYCEKLPVTASEVQKQGAGTGDGKANLLAAMLRYAKIPAGICFQRLLRAEDGKEEYALHAWNAIYLDTEWVFADAGGYKKGNRAPFSAEEPNLAFSCRKEYEEYFVDGIYYAPSEEAMKCLEEAGDFSELCRIYTGDETALLLRLAEINR